MAARIAFVDQRIGQYTVIQKLGEGSMGAVYLAENQELGRRVAVKFLHPQYSSNQEHLHRFINEARAANLVQHPGLVQIFEVGTLEDGTTYLIMELLIGECLDRRLRARGGRLAAAEVVSIAWQLADVLTALHDTGVVHRDLKPGNVMIVSDPLGYQGERVKVLDLGLARLRIEGWQDCELTTRNISMGTPVYMAPEQWLDARDADGRADVYSLGVMIFELLTGAPPLVAEEGEENIGMLSTQADSGPVDECMQQRGRALTKPPPSLLHAAPHAPAALCRLVDAMLTKDRDLRPSMRRVRDKLHGMLQHSAVSHPVPGNMLGLENAPTMIAARKPAYRQARPRPVRKQAYTLAARKRLLVIPALGFLVGLLFAAAVRSAEYEPHKDLVVSPPPGASEDPLRPALDERVSVPAATTQEPSMARDQVTERTQDISQTPLRGRKGRPQRR